MNVKKIEVFTYLFIWSVVFSIPFLRTHHFDDFEWILLIAQWISVAGFCVLFFINIYWLVPQFLFKKKYLKYVLYSFLLLTFCVTVVVTVQKRLIPQKPFGMPSMQVNPELPPMELGNKMPPPKGFRPQPPSMEKTLTVMIFRNSVLALLIFLGGTTIKLLSRWLHEENIRKDVEKEHLKTEIALLRHQVSPHFLMNTLNNIHALIEIDTKKSKDAIIRLSTLMRYLLYDSSNPTVSLQKEMEFITSYISLMQIRYAQSVNIKIDIPEKLPDIHIPSMLVITFVENAFKHGVSYQQQSYVHFALQIKDHYIHIEISNSNFAKQKEGTNHYSGLGLANVRKSLNLLYGEDYTLNIQALEKTHSIHIGIPIENKNNVS